MDWATAASLATAAGTLILAVATFSSVRSASRSTRLAERSLLATLRPVLAASRYNDPMEKVGFADGRWYKVEGGRAVAEVTDSALYMVMSVRNVGSGIAVLHGWYAYPERIVSARDHQPVDAFRRLTRDIYVPSGEVGFWQGAIRDPQDPAFVRLAEAIRSRGGLTIDILYGDNEGGQRSISRFGLSPLPDDGWLVAWGRHWNLDRPDPR